MSFNIARVVGYRDRSIACVDEFGTFRLVPEFCWRGALPAEGSMVELTLRETEVVRAERAEPQPYKEAQVLCPPETWGTMNPLVFTAGPIRGARDWQSDVIESFQKDEKTHHVWIASPRGYVSPDFDYNLQVDWESRYLLRASQFGAIMFWLDREEEHICSRAFAQTTRFELAEWKERLRSQKDPPLILGIHPEFSGNRYIRLRLQQEMPSLKIHSTLPDTIQAAKDFVVSRWPQGRI